MQEGSSSARVETVSSFPLIESYLHYSQSVWNFYRIRRRQESSLFRRMLDVTKELQLANRADIEIPEVLAALQNRNIEPAVSLIEDEAAALLQSFQSREIEPRDLPMSRTKAQKICEALREVGVEKAEEIKDRFHEVGCFF